MRLQTSDKLARVDHNTLSPALVLVRWVGEAVPVLSCSLRVDMIARRRLGLERRRDFRGYGYG